MFGIEHEVAIWEECVSWKLQTGKRGFQVEILKKGLFLPAITLNCDTNIANYKKSYS